MESAAMTTEACPNKETSMEIDREEENEEGHGEEQDIEPAAGNNIYKLVLPKDGYEWKKYGQKFIKNIGKFRSYFKCQRTECSAKKRVEWLASEEQSKANIRVVYKGAHTHLLPSDEAADHEQSKSQGTSSSSSSNPNQYNLLTQVLTLRNQST
ncbi:WRKY domain containing protein [Trema orientale]|uniref:WRKY domain containing protein n=1 Tax=Trema orientale TaxID=63057 RepID=A0A2P5FCZ2_TREOI|nr:WRKY domain containing protein [Trema orientale]